MTCEEYLKERIRYFGPPYLAAFEVPIYQSVKKELEEILKKIKDGDFDRELF